MYLIAKGFALGAFMMLNENEMHENVYLWLIFCIIPSVGFALLLIFFRSFYNTSNRNFLGFKSYNNFSLSILLKEPPVVVAPIVTPFMYSPRTSDFTRIEKFKHKPSIGVSSKRVFFEMDADGSVLSGRVAPTLYERNSCHTI